MLTRYVVTLDDGGKLTAVRQNLDGYAADVLGDRGTTVTVAWRDDQTCEIRLAKSPGGPEERVMRRWIPGGALLAARRPCVLIAGLRIIGWYRPAAARAAAGAGEPRRA